MGISLRLPCGRCIGCRLERSRQWAMRCVHEASLYENNCFITLTYDDENLPVDGSLNLKHFQDFMKRLRSRFSESPIRFFHCGEYGSACKVCGLSRPRCSCVSFIPGIGRPHYHACLFNFDFADRVHFKKVKDTILYTSADLASLWTFGFSTVGNVSFESAAYVARYIVKKITGDIAQEHYSVFSRDTGEVFQVVPEYTTMSRRPGIARDWYEKFSDDVFPDDFVVLRGRRMKPPRFYDSIYEIDDPDEYARLKEVRVQEALARAADSTYERLRDREVVKTAQVFSLQRSLDDAV